MTTTEQKIEIYATYCDTHCREMGIDPSAMRSHPRNGPCSHPVCRQRDAARLRRREERTVGL